MKANVAWIIGNGKRVLFWEHRWVPGLCSSLIESAVAIVPEML